MKIKIFIFIICLIITFFLGRLSYQVGGFKWNTTNEFDLCYQTVFTFQKTCVPITRDPKTNIKTIWYTKRYYNK
jgi:hypothetical protein